MNVGNPHAELQSQRRRILIVADDRSRVRDLNAILAPAGYNIADVNSAEAALEYYLQFEPDLVLLDVELPGADVFEVCRSLKNCFTGVAATVVFIAARSDPEAVAQGLAAGGVEFLSEPFRPPEVLARLRLHLLHRLHVAQLSKDDKEKNRLLCMAAHDLRNPLVSIRALATFLRNGTTGPLTEEQRDFVNTIHDASHSMLDLVNELLDVCVLDAGEWKINVKPTSLSKLVAASVKLTNATAAQKGSVIVWQPGPLPEQLAIDGPKVSQVLNNLFGNAIKFSPPGSTITVKPEVTSSHCAISVRDQGPGIKAGEFAKLFKFFGRTSVKPTAGEPSTGLGLAICRKIMLGHDGTIQAENVPGGGAEFRITFPIAS